MLANKHMFNTETTIVTNVASATGMLRERKYFAKTSATFLFEKLYYP